jgi:hypothetical protein
LLDAGSSAASVDHQSEANRRKPSCQASQVDGAGMISCWNAEPDVYDLESTAAYCQDAHKISRVVKMKIETVLEGRSKESISDKGGTERVSLGGQVRHRRNRLAGQAGRSD